MIAVDYKPGFEAGLGAASPLTRYAAFVRDAVARRDARRRAAPDGELDQLLRIEGRRLQAGSPADWAAAGRLLEAGRAE